MTDSAPAPSRRWLYIVLGAFGALLIAVIILLVVIVQQNNAAHEQDELTRINKICEQDLADPYGKDLEAFLACQEDLLSQH